jgi:hypothetical protein
VVLRVGGVWRLKAPHIGTITAHFVGVVGVEYEQMFDQPAGTIDQALERERAACRRELGEIAVREARDKQRAMLLVRQANARGDWKAAGCSSPEQWYAQVSGTTYQTAKVVTATAEALGELPAIDEALGTGEMTFDQTAAGVVNATPETDAEIARLAPGKAPSEIALAVRQLNPPKVADDQAVYKRRSLRMAWTPDRSELKLSGSLPHELGVLFENAIWDVAKAQRAADKKDGVVLEWQQSTADALVTLARRDGSDGGVRRSSTTTIVHLSEGGPAMLEGAGPISAETAERLTCDSRILFIKPHGNDLVHSRVGRCVSYPQLRALMKRSGKCQFPGCTATRDLEAHHITPFALGGETVIDDLTLECSRHHQLIHDRGIRTSGTGARPVYTSADGRLITADQPHAPPG